MWYWLGNKCNSNCIFILKNFFCLNTGFIAEGYITVKIILAHSSTWNDMQRVGFSYNKLNIQD